MPSFTPFDKRSRRERLDAILSKTDAAPTLGLSHKIGIAVSVVLAAGLAFAQAALAVAPSPAKEALPETPVEGKITLPFGKKASNLNGDAPTHQGVDISAERGTVVRAAGSGKVVDATDRYHNEPAWGKVVVIDHGHGLMTRYAHLDSYLVHKGDRVQAGAAIAAVGSTGKVTGPHLHFEVIQDGVPIDPTPVVAVEPAAPAAAPRPVVKTKRAVMIAPTPEYVALPEPAVAPETPETPEQLPTPETAPEPDTWGETLDRRLAGRFKNFEERFGEDFGKKFDEDFGEDFGERFAEMFEDFEMDLGDLDIDISGIDSFADFPVIAMNRFEEVRGVEMLSDEEREEFLRAHRNAMKAAKEGMERAKRDRERAQRDIERATRDRELSMREVERDRAERDRERAEAEAERQQALGEARAEREQERAEARTERERERAEREGHMLNEHEALALREKALREAQADLEQELKEIERERAKLERKREKDAKKDR